jgi:hypothetical protein
MPEPRIPISRKAIARHDKRTVAQVDAHVDARVRGLTRRLAVRPVVRVPATHIDVRIRAHSKSLRAKNPEAPGT